MKIMHTMALPIDVLNLQRMSSCFLAKKNVRLFDEFIKIRLIKNKIYGITAKPGHFDKKKTPGIIYVRSTFQNRRRSNCNHCATKEPGRMKTMDRLSPTRKPHLETWNYFNRTYPNTPLLFILAYT